MFPIFIFYFYKMGLWLLEDNEDHICLFMDYNSFFNDNQDFIKRSWKDKERGQKLQESTREMYPIHITLT